MMSNGRNRASIQASVVSCWFPVLSKRVDFLQSLYLVYARNLAHAVDDVFEVLQVGNIENDVDVGLRVRAAHLNIANIGIGVTDHGRDLLEHAETIVAENRKLHRIRTAGSLIVGPFHIPAA